MCSVWRRVSFRPNFGRGLLCRMIGGNGGRTTLRADELPGRYSVRRASASGIHYRYFEKTLALRSLPGLRRRRRHWITCFGTSLNPRLLSVFNLSYRLFGRCPPGATARQIGDVSDIALVLVAPENLN